MPRDEALYGTNPARIRRVVTRYRTARTSLAPACYTWQVLYPSYTRLDRDGDGVACESLP